MYDILEVLFFHEATGNKQTRLERLRETLGGDFEIEEHEFIDDTRQVLRIVAASAAFESAVDFDACIRELADEAVCQWKVIGAVPVGQVDTVLF